MDRVAATIPSVGELRALCDKPRRPHWYIGTERNINMWVSAYLTKPLLLLGCSAHQVTVLSLVVGWAAIACWGIGTPASSLAGALGLHLFYLLDFSDGAIARFRKTTSIHGAFGDHLVHYLVQPPVFFAVGLGWFARTGQIAGLGVGLIAAAGMAMNGIIYDVRQRTILDHLRKGVERSTGHGSVGSPAWLEKAAGAFHLLAHFPTAMYLFTVGAVVDVLWQGQWHVASLSGGAVHAVLLGYAVALPIQCLLRGLGAMRDIEEELQTVSHGRR